MAKKILNDIINAGSPRKRPRKSKVRVEPILPHDKDRIREEASSSFFSTFADRKRHQEIKDSSVGSAHLTLWGVTIATLFLLVFLLLSFFSGAIVDVVPLKAHITLDIEITAHKETGPLSFQMIVLESNKAGTVRATGEREIERKAQGEIIIYNTFSSKSQVLVKNTRFEDPQGKIYRIAKSVTIPGTLVEEGKIVPGRLEATVYADFAGAEYNRGLADFTIPGFAGGPRFDAFYARSKTEMKGGFSGIVKTASDADITKTKQDLQNMLRGTLLADARAQVPDGFILYDEGVFVEFADTEDDVPTPMGDTLQIVERGILYGVIFDKRMLAKTIARASLPLYDEKDIFSRDLGALAFNIIDRDDIDPRTVEEITFELLGNMEIIWSIDESMLVDGLIGLPKNNFNATIEMYGSINKAKAHIRPFWKKSFPTEKKNILIRVVDGFEEEI